MRLFVSMLSHETNTFSPMKTGWEAFSGRTLLRSEEIPRRYTDTRTCLGGMVDGAAIRGVELTWGVAAAAAPAGLVVRDVYDSLKREIVSRLAGAGPVDAVLLDLHGAMVVEGIEDGEGDLLAAVRRAVGSSIPITVTLDLHTNLTEAMVRHADYLTGYKSYPHVDMYERGVEAAERGCQLAAGKIRTARAMQKPPILAPLGNMATARGPMRRLLDRAEEMEQSPSVLSVSVFGGFPLADIRDAGLGILVITDGDQALADRCTQELGELAWKHRHEFLHKGASPAEAVRHAMEAQGGPVVLADMADNPGGGGAGDGTAILHELIRQGARKAVVSTIWDPEAVRECRQAGEGATVTLRVGGKSDTLHGPTIEVTGKVVRLTDGSFVYGGPMSEGLTTSMGDAALLDLGGIFVILNSLRIQSLDPELIRSVGIEPTNAKIVVVKSTHHYRAAFGPIAAEIIEVDGPGLSSSNLSRFAFRQVRRPIFPLDPP